MILRSFALLLLLFFASCESKPQEKVIKVYSNGNPEIIHLIDPESGEKIGHRAYYDDGTLRIEGDYSKDRKHGTWNSYYSDGTRWTINNYVDGEFHGPYFMYNPDGSARIVGQYANGEESGHWKFYADDGTLIKEVDY